MPPTCPIIFAAVFAEPTPTRNWDGWYAGGQVGYSSANMDFSQSLVGLTNFIYRDSMLAGADVTTVGAGQGQPPSHRLRRVRRPQLPMGRPRFRRRGQLQLHQRPHRFFHLFNWAASIQLSAGTDHACKRHPHLYSDFERQGRRADQGCDHVQGPSGLGDRQFPALYIRRSCGWPHGYCAHREQHHDQTGRHQHHIPLGRYQHSDRTDTSGSISIDYNIGRKNQ